MRLFGLLLLCSHLCLGELNVKDESLPHSVQRRAPEQSLVATKFTVSGGPIPSVGDTVVFTCNVTFDKDNKADEVELQLIWTKPGDNSTTVLMTEKASRGISFTLGPFTSEHRGLYSCHQVTGPNVFTLDWHQFISIKDPSAPVSLDVISVGRVKFFYDKTVTIGCRVPDDNSEWKILRADVVYGFIGECPGQMKKDGVVKCTIQSKYHLELFHWCQSADGQASNAIDVKQTWIELRNKKQIVGIKFEVTPAWFLRPGDDTVLNCNVHTDRHNNSHNLDLQLIWTQLHSEENMTVLLSRRASQGFSHSLVNVTWEQQGVYSCWDDGTRVNVSVHPWHHFIWVENDSPPRVNISILSPNRSQFFHLEKVTLGCQLPNNQSQWQIKWFDEYTGQINSCHKPELSSSGFLSCVKYMGNPWSTKLFWCESSTGERSNLLNTTNTVAHIVLEAPTVPVTEGDDVTLRCWQKDRTTKEITPARAGFHSNYKFLGKSEEGIMTIYGITKAREGYFQCSTRREGMSHKTWISVKARV